MQGACGIEVAQSDGFIIDFVQELSADGVVADKYRQLILVWSFPSSTA